MGSMPILQPLARRYGYQRPNPSAEIVACLRKLMIRHTKAQRINGAAALSLPEADTSTVYLTMNAEEQRLYKIARKLDGRLKIQDYQPYYLDNALRRQRQSAANAYVFKAQKKVLRKGLLEKARADRERWQQACKQVEP